MVNIFTFHSSRQIECYCGCDGQHKSDPSTTPLKPKPEDKLHFIAKRTMGLRIITSDESGSLRRSYCLNCGFKIALDLLPNEEQWKKLALVFVGDSFSFNNTEHIKHLAFPVQCKKCGDIYDLAGVETIQRFQDCTVFKTPCCNQQADDNVFNPGLHFTKLDNSFSGLTRTEIKARLRLQSEKLWEVNKAYGN